jgi:hypothetical protein
MVMIKHDKCQAYEDKIKALEQQVKEYQEFREVQTSKVRELEKKLSVASELIREAYEDTDLYTYYEMMPRFKEALSKIKEMK